MAENFSDKTEPATPKRRQEAREAGNTAKSQDLTSSVLLLTGIYMLGYMGPRISQSLSDLLRSLLGNMYWGTATELMDNSLRISVYHLLRCLGPILLTIAGAAFLVSVMQVGLHLTAKPLTPNLAKLNPLKGFGRLFGGQNWFQLGMNVTKMVTVGVIGYMEFQGHLAEIVALSGVAFPANFSIASGIIYDVTMKMALALFILAFCDWMYHKWKFEKDIRMSKQEIKDESKMMEGDMEIKARRRQLARKMLMQRIQRDVPHADVVVTNPTELAIAIKYDPDTMTAPRVVAKGSGFLAARIRQIAIQNGVPIMERKPLAQALYKSVEIGQEVPAEYYQSIAEILAYVYELAGKGMRKLRAAG